MVKKSAELQSRLKDQLDEQHCINLRHSIAAYALLHCGSSDFSDIMQHTDTNECYQYIASLLENSYNPSSAPQPHELRHIFPDSHIDFALSSIRASERLYNMMGDKEVTQKTIVQEIHEQLGAANVCYLPAEHPGPPGHFLLLKITKNDRGTLIISLINKGEGSESHRTISLSTKGKAKHSYCSPGFIIANQTLSETPLLDQLRLIGIGEKLSDRSFETQHIIRLLSTYSESMSTQWIDDNDKLIATTTQHGGTCVMTCLRLLVRDSLIEHSRKTGLRIEVNDLKIFSYMLKLNSIVLSHRQQQNEFAQLVEKKDLTSMAQCVCVMDDALYELTTRTEKFYDQFLSADLNPEKYQNIHELLTTLNDTLSVNKQDYLVQSQHGKEVQLRSATLLNYAEVFSQPEYTEPEVTELEETQQAPQTTTCAPEIFKYYRYSECPNSWLALIEKILESNSSLTKELLVKAILSAPETSGENVDEYWGQIINPAQYIRRIYHFFKHSFLSNNADCCKSYLSQLKLYDIASQIALTLKWGEKYVLYMSDEFIENTPNLYDPNLYEISVRLKRSFQKRKNGRHEIFSPQIDVESREFNEISELIDNLVDDKKKLAYKELTQEEFPSPRELFFGCFYTLPQKYLTLLRDQLDAINQLDQKLRRTDYYSDERRTISNLIELHVKRCLPKDLTTYLEIDDNLIMLIMMSTQITRVISAPSGTANLYQIDLSRNKLYSSEFVHDKWRYLTQRPMDRTILQSKKPVSGAWFHHAMYSDYMKKLSYYDAALLKPRDPKGFYYTATKKLEHLLSDHFSPLMWDHNICDDSYSYENEVMSEVFIEPNLCLSRLSEILYENILNESKFDYLVKKIASFLFRHNTIEKCITNNPNVINAINLLQDVIRSYSTISSSIYSTVNQLLSLSFCIKSFMITHLPIESHNAVTWVDITAIISNTKHFSKEENNALRVLQLFTVLTNQFTSIDSARFFNPRSIDSVIPPLMESINTEEVCVTIVCAVLYKRVRDKDILGRIFNDTMYLYGNELIEAAIRSLLHQETNPQEIIRSLLIDIFQLHESIQRADWTVHTDCDKNIWLRSSSGYQLNLSNGELYHNSEIIILDNAEVIQSLKPQMLKYGYIDKSDSILTKSYLTSPNGNWRFMYQHDWGDDYTITALYRTVNISSGSITLKFTPLNNPPRYGFCEKDKALIMLHKLIPDSVDKSLMIIAQKDNSIYVLSSAPNFPSLHIDIKNKIPVILDYDPENSTLQFTNKSIIPLSEYHLGHSISKDIYHYWSDRLAIITSNNKIYNCMITVTLASENIDLHSINLTELNLFFEIDETGRMLSREFPGYYISSSRSSTSIGGYNGVLVLDHISENKTIFLMPKYLFSQHTESHAQPVFDRSLQHINNEEKKYFIFRVSDEQLIEPLSVEQYLYLSYIHLIQGDHSKSLKYLYNSVHHDVDSKFTRELIKSIAKIEFNSLRVKKLLTTQFSRRHARQLTKYKSNVEVLHDIDEDAGEKEQEIVQDEKLFLQLPEMNKAAVAGCTVNILRNICKDLCLATYIVKPTLMSGLGNNGGFVVPQFMPTKSRYFFDGQIAQRIRNLFIFDPEMSYYSGWHRFYSEKARVAHHYNYEHLDHDSQTALRSFPSLKYCLSLYYSSNQSDKYTLKSLLFHALYLSNPKNSFLPRSIIVVLMKAFATIDEAISHLTFNSRALLKEAEELTDDTIYSILFNTSFLDSLDRQKSRDSAPIKTIFDNRMLMPSVTTKLWYKEIEMRFNNDLIAAILSELNATFKIDLEQPLAFLRNRYFDSVARTYSERSTSIFSDNELDSSFMAAMKESYRRRIEAFNSEQKYAYTLKSVDDIDNLKQDMTVLRKELSGLIENYRRLTIKSFNNDNGELSNSQTDHIGRINLAKLSTRISSMSIDLIIKAILTNQSLILQESNPGLCESDIQSGLAYFAITCILIGINNRLNDAFELLSKFDLEEQPQQAHLVAQLLTFNLDLDYAKHPECLVFMHQSGRVLRDEQYQAYINITENSQQGNQLLQLPAGAGKTSCLIPLLSYWFSKNGKLPFVITTNELYHTMLIELPQLLSTYFNQKVEILDFPLNYNWNNELEKIQAITLDLDKWNSENICVIIKAETWHSLNLAYKNPAVRYPVRHALSVLLQTIKKLAVKLEDECHIVSDPKHEYIVASGQSTSIPTEHRLLLLTLYQALFNITGEHEELAVMAGMKNGSINVISDAMTIEIRQQLIDFIIQSNPLSMLAPIDKITAYLSADHATRPDWLNTLNASDQKAADLIVLSRAFLHTHLPLLLKYQLHKDYGFSIHQSDLTAAPKHDGKDTTSHFSDPYIWASLTIQLYYQQGVSDVEYIQKKLAILQSEHRINAKTYKPAGCNTPQEDILYSGFEFHDSLEQLTGACNLDSISNADLKQLATSNNFRMHPYLIERYLFERVLGQVKLSDQSICSTASDLSEGFSISVSVTATPGIVETYPLFTHAWFDNNFEPSVVQTMLEDCNDKVSVIEHITADSTIDAINAEEGRVSALIDRGGLLSDTHYLAQQYCGTDSARSLYYFKSGELACFKANGNIASVKKPGAITDLSMNPKAIMLYSLANTTGADMVLPYRSHAVMTYGKSITLSQAIQAIMRMRKFLEPGGQTISWLISAEMASKQHLPNGPSVTSLLDNFLMSEQKDLIGKVIQRSYQSINAIIEAYFLRKTIDSAQTLPKANVKLVRPFDVYEKITAYKNADITLKQYIENQCRHYGINYQDEISVYDQSRIDQIISDAKRLLGIMSSTSSSITSEVTQELVTEQEMTQEHLVEVEKEKKDDRLFTQYRLQGEYYNAEDNLAYNIEDGHDITPLILPGCEKLHLPEVLYCPRHFDTIDTEGNDEGIRLKNIHGILVRYDEASKNFSCLIITALGMDFYNQQVARYSHENVHYGLFGVNITEYNTSENFSPPRELLIRYLNQMRCYVNLLNGRVNDLSELVKLIKEKQLTKENYYALANAINSIHVSYSKVKLLEFTEALSHLCRWDEQCTVAEQVSAPSRLGKQAAFFSQCGGGAADAPHGNKFTLPMIESVSGPSG